MAVLKDSTKRYNIITNRDSSSLKTEIYYNKRHRSEKITKILNLVNEQCLDGEALKSQPGSKG